MEGCAIIHHLFGLSYSFKSFLTFTDTRRASIIYFFFSISKFFLMSCMRC
jgi:hypothetical protein